MLTATPFTDVEFKQRLFNANLRRLQELQLQAAWQGLSCPPAVSMEIEALERELQEIHGISPPLQHSVAQSSSSQRTLVMVILLKKILRTVFAGNIEEITQLSFDLHLSPSPFFQ